MANSAGVLLDLTLSDLEGQNPYLIHFSNQLPQNGFSSGKSSWMAFIFGNGLPEVIIHAGVDFRCNMPFRWSLYGKNM